MTFQSSLPEIDIIPEGENKDQSYLQQLLHNRTPNPKAQEQQEMLIEEQSPPVRRKLFQERKLYKGESDIEEEVEEIKQMAKVKSDNRSALPGYQVHKDYTVMLNLTDISYGVKGHNKFYQIQVLKKDGDYFLFTKWGRTGASNPQQEIKESDLVTAIKGFEKKFRDKTHWDWRERTEFKQQPGKYCIVDVLGGGGGSVNSEIEKLNQRNGRIAARIKNLPSTLDPPIFELMSEIWDIQRMNKTLKELNFDTDKNPLGRLSVEAIKKGFKILNEIQQALRDFKYSLLVDLTNEFYTNIPQNYGMKLPPKIDNYEILGQKNQLLTVLQELELANRYINSTLAENSDVNPLDQFYRLLKTNIRECQDFDVISKIEHSINVSHGPTHEKFKLQVAKVYEVERKNEKIRFFPFKALENRKLLWHGSRITNFVGILSEGLKIAPPEAPSTGYMFGKGVYFADICSKSAGYCVANIDHPYGYVLLCEVALGNTYQIYKAKDHVRPPQNYHSIHAVGRNHADPKTREKINNLDFESGKVIPNEELKIHNIESSLIYNEYVVYDVAQVQIHYLIKLKFIF
ncbi:unnamed protein product (macronuclear) [Paramecium tetraurelia]|uniref:Poly [ADP-ribose] polymerase n=1 Tax=Paramecium tetraurelia TaxID=5888 RepID=A0BXK8_PARTE|nr:uncharacterized protein GSPATT00033128001 [Paramecium tetraurelia]CAK63275.1 unnamed protein product [Paramecium tetraurelia]|eukprot:XP_001430673.1 hypothetical protein (macronuclear) [Paramecium tetraurelia strain d4-2]